MIEHQYRKVPIGAARAATSMESGMALAQVLEERSRAPDVGEEERDGARRSSVTLGMSPWSCRAGVAAQRTATKLSMASPISLGTSNIGKWLRASRR